MSEEPERKFDLKKYKTISRAISSYEDLTLLIDHLAEGTTRTFGAKGCSIMLLDERENQLFTVSCYGISEEYMQKGPLFIDDKYCAFIRGKPVYVKNMQEDQRIKYPESALKEGIVSMLSIPIIFKNIAIGLIRIYRSDMKGFHEEDIDTMLVMAMHLGLVIEINGLRNFLDGVNMAMENLPPRILKNL